MSTSIGIAYSSNGMPRLFEELSAIANEYGYRLLKGIANSESDVVEGLKLFSETLSWDEIALIQSPADQDAALAFEIHEELTRLETSGAPPKFFNFLRVLGSRFESEQRSFALFFAGEWDSDDRVRFNYGSIEDLIALLSMPGHWCLRYLDPKTGRLQDSDEIPMIFEVSRFDNDSRSRPIR